MRYSAALFALSVFFNYYFPETIILNGGFIVAIFLSAFIEIKYATVVLSAASFLATSIIAATKAGSFSYTQYISINLLQAGIIIFSAGLVVYVKRLMHHMQFDKKHMTSLFENATEGIILTGGKGEIVLVNPAAERLFGYTKDELKGQLIEMLIPDRFQGGHHNLRGGFYQDPGDRQMGVGRDLYAKKRDGSEFPVEISISFYKENTTPYVIAFIVDITSRKSNEQKIKKHQEDLLAMTENLRLLNNDLEQKVNERTFVLKEAMQKLEESQRELNKSFEKERQMNELKSRFVSMASHEFRTPLSTILSSASLLSKYTAGTDQEKRDKHINRIKGSVTNLNDILEDFLSLGKLDEGKMSPTIGAFDLNDFLKVIIDEMKAHLRAGQEISYSFKGAEEFYSDHKLLRNICINLISNAIKFSPDASEIIVDCQVENGNATMQFTDQGIGISEEDQRHLFTSFFRGNNAANIQGTGMGLHIVKRYLELLHGTIAVESNLLRGSTFTIVLPSFQ